MRVALLLLALVAGASAYASGSTSATGASNSAYASAPTPPAPTPKKTPTPAPTPPTPVPVPAGQKTVTVVTISSAISLAGTTPAMFSKDTAAGRAAQEGFKNTVSSTIKLCGTSGTGQCKAADVTINSITAGRRAGTKIDFSVKVTVSKAKAAAGATTMATFLANADPATGFAAILKKEATKAGATAIAAIPAAQLTVTVTKAPGAVSKVTTVPTPTPTVASAASTTATVSLATLAFVALALQ